MNLPHPRRQSREAPLGASLVLGLSALASLLGSCGSSAQAREREEEEPPAQPAFAGPAVVSGTAIEASTGRPLAGVEILGPDGSLGRSDRDGRFELVGLATGLTGVLQARTEEGLLGENRLRPLSSGRLEVVIYLR